MSESIERCRTPRLLLTRIGDADLADLTRMYADERVMATLGGVRSAEQTRGYLKIQQEHWQRHGFGFWAARDPASNGFVGRGGLRQANINGKDEIEVGYGFMAEYWGQGFATELAAKSVRVAFDVLGMKDLVCFTLPTNLASRRVMEKVGFRYEADAIYAGLPHILCRLRA